MGILDEAIREHLELKRRHGAEQEELRKLENEAFGPAPRAEEPGAPVAGEEQLPAGESEGPEPLGQTTREVIAQQPTEVFDVASEIARHHPGSEEEAAAEPGSQAEAGEEAAPETVEAEAPEPPAAEAVSEAAPVEADLPSEGKDPEAEADADPAPETEAVVEQPAVTEPAEGAGETAPEPPTEVPAEGAEAPEIFDEQALSEELEQALEGPTSSEARRAAFFEETDEFQAPPQRPSRQPEPAPETSEHDLLDETPEFLEETPEHDRLWFEQKPPKDFDFND